MAGPFKSWKEFYEPRFHMADETMSRLGEEKAGRFVDLANDWIDIEGAILDSYPQDELTQSMTFLRFQGLFKELYWLQLLFLGSNYPLVIGRLRSCGSRCLKAI